jgi:hypothetical protein
MSLPNFRDSESELKAVYGETAMGYAINHPGAVAATLEALRRIPTDFVPVSRSMPSHDRPVLAIRLASDRSSTYEVMTARYMRAHRPRNPWRDISGGAVNESGGDILGWREAPEWLAGR